MDLSNLILFFCLVSFGLLFYKYFLILLYKYKPKLLIDDQFEKPQAFHEYPISVAGGSCIYLSFLIAYFSFVFFKNTIFFDYFSFCTIFFFLGFVDDIKININPTIRLIFMIILLILLVKYNNLYIEKTGIEILNNWITSSKIFSLIFICLCFLFVINGANLIDGYNGLLTIHSLIILLNFLLINYLNSNNDLVNLLFFSIVIFLVFLLFNFPKAKIFLGDGGSYFLGAFVALSAIKTSIANPTISPFYFCIMLFYLFFEVFFSFLRKLIKERNSPIRPDKKHLHMLLYKLLLKKYDDKAKSNYYVSIIINLIYLLFIIPAAAMMQNGTFCKYYSILLFFVYIFSYKLAYEKTK